MSFYDKLKFNSDGLIPAIVQDHGTKRVLMMAWMNRASLERTVESGRTCFWSRSRQKFWVKGETSGHVQRVRDIAFDCDGDTLLIQVEQTGAACHEGYRSCFFRSIEGGEGFRLTEPRLEDESKA
jgi:phosphoribosyl-AMP cyclohydrolase